jgi:hypothetical protein
MVIVDTGSTDGTQEIIREHMRDTLGELYERLWVDIARNRTEANRREAALDSLHPPLATSPGSVSKPARNATAERLASDAERAAKSSLHEAGGRSIYGSRPTGDGRRIF